MTGSTESLRIYIAVDRTKVSRCKWCGTVESERWLGSDRGIYCSSGCSLADYANRTSLGFLMLFVAVIPGLAILGAPMNPSTILIGLALVAVLFSPLLCFGVVGHIRRRETPRDSRRDDLSLDVAMLQAMSSSVLCPRCDANIDVSKIREDRVYTCDYCGASGNVEIVNTQ